ncbi:MAG: sugar phosphate isomerase/epimerase family protein [Microscillaceae bacterium]|nr:sugar phosphate isomerase/epimerase family protein [Microscillaceae bacterium]
MKRRQFVQNISLGLAAAGILPIPTLFANPLPPRKFKMCLNPGNVGIQVNQKELLALAHRIGFEAILPMPQELAKMNTDELNAFMTDMKAKNMAWDAAGLPIDFRKTEEKFREDLKQLPALADALQKAGVKGCGTWIMPTHHELTYRENFEQHRARLKETANVLGHYGLKLGLEYVGPKTLMSRDKFSFIRTMRETKELLEAIGEKNVGLILDSFHWFCAGESAADILTLDKEDIITCDLNDARKDLSVDQQIDGTRELPTATGVINLKDFLGALRQIGYDGVIRAEPFNAKLNDMDNEAAAKATFEAMKKAFELG